MRVYSSRLLGREPSLVLHGGGNTSVKVTERDFFGDELEVLYVKGSGWDLATIEKAGFSPVRMDTLTRLAGITDLRDTDMVTQQRTALLDPYAPNPSVEAILHALIPFRFVDHTHTDAVVTLTNSPDGEARIRALYGDRVLYIPYVMPGFILARTIAEMTAETDWSKLEGMVLLNHGLFTFHDDAQQSYERMITLVSEAEEALKADGAWDAPHQSSRTDSADLVHLSTIRQQVSLEAGRPMLAILDHADAARGFAERDDVFEIATRGPITPDHVIRTKRVPLMVSDDPHADRETYAADYRAYFHAHATEGLTMLDCAPRWAVWPRRGTIAFGESAKRAQQVADISRHTVRAIQWGEALGGWTPLDPRHIFEVEYWELEQAKLKRGGSSPPMQGRVALVTGAQHGIGAAVASALRAEGAAVCALDLDPQVERTYAGIDSLGVVCDVTDSDAVNAAVHACVERFGGLDIVVTNAGNFPLSQSLDTIDDGDWERSDSLNLTSHMKVLRAATPFLKLGIDPAVVIIASRNVLAPGPGVASYSAPKAALTQLGRVAALELAPHGVRVNTLHPDKVFDTALWDDDKLQARADHYGISVAEYKRQNLLRMEVRAEDVGALAAAMASPTFRCTTGAQVPVDGGSNRVV